MEDRIPRDRTRMIIQEQQNTIIVLQLVSGRASESRQFQLFLILPSVKHQVPSCPYDIRYSQFLIFHYNPQPSPYLLILIYNQYFLHQYIIIITQHSIMSKVSYHHSRYYTPAVSLSKVPREVEKPKEQAIFSSMPTQNSIPASVHIEHVVKQQERNEVGYQNRGGSEFRPPNRKVEGEEKVRETRRSRNDPLGRDYKCGCGKRYLSYPALYTHIRQKHNGVELQGTNKTLEGANTKRGRPKKYLNDEVFMENQLDQMYHDQSQSSTNQKLHLMPFNKKAMKIFSEYFDILQGSCHAEERLKDQKFLRHVKYIRQHDIKDVDSSIPIDEVLAIFLFNMAQECNSSFFTYLEQSLLCLRSCLNQHYRAMPLHPQSFNRIFNVQFVSGLFNQQEEYCQSNTCEYIPLICEYFVTTYAQTHMKKADTKLLACIVCDLCVWMDQYKMCRFKISRVMPEIPKRRHYDDDSEEIYFG